MRPIILDMKDMSDSTEVYESRPNPFLIYFIYVLLALFVAAFIWMYFFQIDIVVKSNGMFRCEESGVSVSSNASGVVTACNISEGQYVQEGELLFTLEAESLENSLTEQKALLEDVEERILILKAYENYLDGEENALESCCDNRYYEEFLDRKQLLELNEKNIDTDADTQESQYRKELDNVDQLISQYEEQIAKLEQTEKCIKDRNNSFGETDSYYASIVSSYLSNYELTVSQYDKQIAEYEKQKSAEESQDKIEQLQASITELSAEKKATLNNLELQQIATIEQQIETVKSSLNSARSNQSSIQVQLEILNKAKTSDTKELNLLSEKQSVAAELTSYETKRMEYEAIIKQYELESEGTKVTAASSGYICLTQELCVGSYVTQGSSVCQILPEGSCGYYAELYVENSDIAKIQEGQEVKFEIAAYPSSEYGYFTGVVDSISKDIKVDQSSGSAYYLVKVKCEQTTVTNKDGETGYLMNGMACQAKVVVDDKNVLSYLLEKLDLID